MKQHHSSYCTVVIYNALIFWRPGSLGAKLRKFIVCYQGKLATFEWGSYNAVSVVPTVEVGLHILSLKRLSFNAPIFEKLSWLLYYHCKLFIVHLSPIIFSIYIIIDSFINRFYYEKSFKISRVDWCHWPIASSLSKTIFLLYDPLNSLAILLFCIHLWFISKVAMYLCNTIHCSFEKSSYY